MSLCALSRCIGDRMSSGQPLDGAGSTGYIEPHQPPGLSWGRVRRRRRRWRRYATADRDFVVIVSTEVTTPTIELLLAECVRVVQLDPFYQNDLAKQLVRRGATGQRPVSE